MFLTPKPYIGGQAVLEGVMMRSPRSFVVAVRRSDGTLVVREEAWTALGSAPALKWPLIRGAVTLLESLWNGYSALAFSAEQAQPAEASPPPGPAGEAEPPAGEKSDTWIIAGAMALSSLLAISLFVATPHILTVLVGRWLGIPLPTTGLAFHLVDGVLKAAVFGTYLALISRTPDMKRVFQYHGAEHKAIWAYESGGPLTAEEASRYSTLHPRCGTSFLVMVIAVSAIVSALVFSQVPQLSPRLWVHHLLLVLLKVPLAFPIAGLTYELQRVTARPECPRFLTWLAKPGLALQRVTTQEPSLPQLEVAVVALSRALAREQGLMAEDGVHLVPTAYLPLAPPAAVP